jgi:hypothetical protein
MSGKADKALFSHEIKKNSKGATPLHYRVNNSQRHFCLGTHTVPQIKARIGLGVDRKSKAKYGKAHSFLRSGVPRSGE